MSLAIQQHNRKVCEDAFNKFVLESNELAENMKKKKNSQRDSIRKKVKLIEDQFEGEFQHANDLLQVLHNEIREFSSRQEKISAQIAAFDTQCKDLQNELQEEQKYEESVAQDQIDEKLNQVSAAIERALETKPTETKISQLLKATVSVLLD